jgi:hypothetical protein
MLRGALGLSRNAIDSTEEPSTASGAAHCLRQPPRAADAAPLFSTAD